MGLDFVVTPAVLVPNPDTEVLVQRAVELAREQHARCGSRTSEQAPDASPSPSRHYAPNVDVVASDITTEALEVARRNVEVHGLGDRVQLICGDLMGPFVGSFDLVCANLPYVAGGITPCPEVVAQPARALYADVNGSALVTRLMDDSRHT